MTSQRTILTIAGSDSGGGAGIQADLRTFAAHGHFGTSAITALTAQNTTGVQGIHGIASVLDDIEIHSCKTGMLFDAANTSATVKALKARYTDGKIPPLVCDPVCVSTSGHSLLAPDALQVMVKEVFPLATLVTPNKSEAELLLSRSINTLEDMIVAAGDLLRLGPQAVLLKGGHMTTTVGDVARLSAKGVLVVGEGVGDENMRILAANSSQPESLVVDVLCEADGTSTIFTRPRINSSSTHGTGCTLSAALACALADGATVFDAVVSATAYTHLGIVTATKIGRGYGPLNHLHSLAHRGIPLRTPTNTHPFTRLLISRNSIHWKEFVEHDFVQALGRGTLPQASFVHFIKQDYHYLKLLAAKSTSFPLIASATKTITNVLHELDTHRALCASFGISGDELETTEESTETIAYGCFLMDMGLQGDTTKLLISVLACLLGYGEVGLWLKSEAAREGSGIVLEDNPYRRWIEDYSGPLYQEAVRAGLDLVESVAAADPPSSARLEEWCVVWDRCTRLEKAFWDMGLAVSR
ncbi:Phosphomethylpyrimidine kinase-domain-containing protein [Mycena amicta]|nr:Phosphomethylpyrimidine kinase-domain-containing protein [Mycena amicta]